jgi:hypothetical protein
VRRRGPSDPYTKTASAALRIFDTFGKTTFATLSPREQTSVSYAADCDFIVCYGGAKLDDKHLASTIHCIDGEVIEWLKRRERRIPQSARSKSIASAS